MRRYSLLLILSCALAGCAVNQPAGDEDAMMIKAAELIKLSTAVEASVRYEAEQSARLDDAALLKFATRDDAALLERFSGYALRLARGDRHVAVLVCSADGWRGLFEDAGCTVAMDRHAWREADSRCEFRLDLATLCAVKDSHPVPRVNPAAVVAPAAGAPVMPKAAPAPLPVAAPVPVPAPTPAPASAPPPVPAALPAPTPVPQPVTPPEAAPQPEAVPPEPVFAAMPAEPAPVAAAPAPPAPAVTMARPVLVPLIEVAGMAWTREINRDSKQPVAAITQSSPGKRLVLWMSVQGSELALDQLAASGKLPLRHKWFRETLSGIRPEGVAMPLDEIEIPAARAGLIAKLRQEVRSLGHFNWRTWSSKEKPGPGNWRVTVYYADNTPVLCSTPEGQRPCEYQIEVR